MKGAHQTSAAQKSHKNKHKRIFAVKIKEKNAIGVFVCVCMSKCLFFNISEEEKEQTYERTKQNETNIQISQ